MLYLEKEIIVQFATSSCVLNEYLYIFYLNFGISYVIQDHHHYLHLLSLIRYTSHHNLYKRTMNSFMNKCSNWRHW